MVAAGTVPVTPPVPEALFQPLALALLISGLLASGSFFVREELSTGRRRGLPEEVMLAGVAATCLGFGTVFLLLACGVYLG
ncbi:hypothetical protein COHA_008392 [Chlorella ohadii]|uniref:Dolichyl-diphosphooligosaccharide-protein glycosyltransferase subunit OST5 n=1 Tax=Chlorella ohadii TaxID=2649997 RepID=A0AAD5DIV3_9CHLO|nr:hypothetical protein COHA_008392 [Chlorella ohadii]